MVFTFFNKNKILNFNQFFLKDCFYIINKRILSIEEIFMGPNANWQSFSNYLLANEQWLSPNIKDNTHEQDGILDKDEINVFFSSRNIDVFNNETMDKEGFDNWYDSNKSAIRKYYKDIDLGLDYSSEEGRNFMRTSMDDFVAHLNEDKDLTSFIKLTNWEDAHVKNMENLIDGVIDESTYLEAGEKIGLDFDFMEGKDPKDEEAYNEQTLKLGQGEMEVKDLDGNGEVEFNEYFTQETAGDILRYKEMIKAGEIDEETVIDMLSEVYIQANAVFEIIDKHMGDKNGTLDEKEFQQYYIHLDEYVGDGTTDRNGSINIDQISEYPLYLANQFDLSAYKDSSEVREIIKTLIAA